MAEKKKEKAGLLKYKGLPLVRQDDTIYYGNPTDPFIVAIHILDKDKKGDLDMSSKTSIELMSTDPDVGDKERVLRYSEKNGLYNAINIGSIWLDRALKGKI